MDTKLLIYTLENFSHLAIILGAIVAFFQYFGTLRRKDKNAAICLLDELKYINRRKIELRKKISDEDCKLFSEPLFMPNCSDHCWERHKHRLYPYLSDFDKTTLQEFYKYCCEVDNLIIGSRNIFLKNQEDMHVLSDASDQDSQLSSCTPAEVRVLAKKMLEGMTSVEVAMDKLERVYGYRWFLWWLRI